MNKHSKPNPDDGNHSVGSVVKHLFTSDYDLSTDRQRWMKCAKNNPNIS